MKVPVTLILAKVTVLPLGGAERGVAIMKESTKKTLKRVAEIVITIITALLTTLGAHAAGIVQ